MVTQEEIESTGFEYSSTVNSYIDSKYDRDIYVAEAFIEKDEIQSMKFPIKLEAFPHLNEIKITSHYANKTLFNEYFFIGEASTLEVLQSALKSLNFSIRERTLDSLEEYYSQNKC